MTCGNRRRIRLLQQMSCSQTVHTVDSSSQQISRRNVRKQIIYKIRKSTENQGGQSSRWPATKWMSTIDVVVGGKNCDSQS